MFLFSTDSSRDTAGYSRGLKAGLDNYNDGI